jgi:hypothetical protein
VVFDEVSEWLRGLKLIYVKCLIGCGVYRVVIIMGEIWRLVAFILYSSEMRAFCSQLG